jgi:hypothetical protein
MTITAILPSRNTVYGFYGTITAAPERDRTSDAVWALASARIAAAANCTSEVEMEGVRDFLDSRMGRHFGDAVVDRMTRGTPTERALDETVADWCSQRISRATGRDAGIPAGLPALVGWVQHFAICAEAEGDDA